MLALVDFQLVVSLYETLEEAWMKNNIFSLYGLKQQLNALSKPSADSGAFPQTLIAQSSSRANCDPNLDQRVQVLRKQFEKQIAESPHTAAIESWRSGLSPNVSHFNNFNNFGNY